jgi:hypothetical protein
MSENISMTRIVDLPDTAGAFGQNSLGADMYIPINGHPNPYGIPPPPVGGIPPPQQTQSGPTQYKNTMYSSNVQQVPNAPQYSQEQFNEMFTQEQRLPQRDIPMNISQHIQDEQIQPNYIPKPKLTSDYIQDYQESTDRKIREHEEKKIREKKAASWFDEFQIPIMISLLYFIFQLPIINTVIFKRFSFLSIYREDGNFNLLGLTLKSIIFSSIFYSFHKSIELISNF